MNISQAYGAAIPGEECEAFFSRLFESMPEVLFVVGAANGGHTNGGGCPAGLSPGRDNVVSVASTHSDGNFTRWSNRGSEVDVAAPEGGPAMSRNGQVRSMSGTSYSAAWVSNLALGYFAEHPLATPRDVKARLYASCAGQSIDVACGGSIDAHRFLSRAHE